MSDDVDVIDAPARTGIGSRCADFDDDCADVPCKLHCWLYDPAKGLCPYLTGEIRE